jgi:hypothetical protein
MIPFWNQSDKTSELGCIFVFKNVIRCNEKANIAKIHGYFCQKSQLLAENVGPYFRFAKRKILYTPLVQIPQGRPEKDDDQHVDQGLAG